MLFTPEHDELRRSIRRFIELEIDPFVDEWESAGAWPAHQVCKRAGQAGFLGITKPIEYGGLGLDFSYTTVWAEELGRIRSAGIASALSIHSDMATPALALHGSDELRREFLAPSIAGDLLGCVGVSETGAGSDVASVKTTARRNGNSYIINGHKMWTTNGRQADWICLLCNTGQAGAPHRNKSLIIVPLDAKGVTRGAQLDKLGMRSIDTAPLFFEDVEVPCRFRIGEEGQGFMYQMEQFTEERLIIAARTTTQLDAAIAATIDYTRQRVAYNAPLLDHQWIHYRLAELQAEIESLRALVYRTVEMFMAGDDVKLLTAAVKLQAGKLARQIPDDCLQFWGGMGYMLDSPISRIARDLRLIAIGGGANEVMLSIIAKEMGISPQRQRSAPADSQTVSNKR